MNQALEHPSVKSQRIVRNGHFWAIVAIMAALIVFYNASHIDIASWLPWLKEVFTIEFIHDLHRSLFLIPLLYAGAVFRLRGAIIAWLVFLAAVLPRALYFSPYPDSLARTLIFASVALLAGVLIALEENQRQGEKEALAQLEVEHHTYLSQILKAQEDERQRIAQELHDDTIQSLLSIANQSQAVAVGDYGELNPQAKRHIEEIKDMILGVSEGMRRLSHDLRPGILDHMGLLPAIRYLAERMNQESNINAEVTVNGAERRLNPEAEVVVFRIVQEALNNIRRHSGATKAVITAEFTPQGFKITVWDNGRGFRLPQKMSDFVDGGKLGLNGMQQRARLLDAAFNIQSQPGDGTTVTLEARG